MHSKTVLVIDDDGDSRHICATILAHHGFRVLEAEDGPSAIEIARERCPDLILLDLSLPVMDGWAVLERLQGGGETDSIPVVVLTASASPEDRIRGRRIGVGGYLVKPCSPALILDEVLRLTSATLPDPSASA